MRYEVDSTTSDGQAYAATPHYDDFQWDDMTHCILPPSGGYPGGFVDGREDIYDNWVATGHHPSATTGSYWGNTELILKCDGQYASNDGYVHYIDMAH
jgi:hypothetical protein